MARRIIETDEDYEIPGDTDEETPPPPPPAPEPDSPASEPPVFGGGTATTTGTYSTGGGVLGGGIVSPTTGTYVEVDPNDFYWGTVGNDVFHGGLGDDVILGFGGMDSLHGDAGADVINGGEGNDWIDGGADADTLHGDAGDDHIFGGTGNDRLFGGAGNDKLTGGAGVDVMSGGAGMDFYAVGTVEFGANGQAMIAKDIITDFSTAGGSDDVLFLNEPIDTLTDFNQRFGGNAITKTAFEHHYVFLVETGSLWSGYTTTVMIDTNGDQAGGQWFAVAELQGVRIQDLNWTANPGTGFGGNFFL
jgi:Ca2+-binding RTX toxin-like protein